MPASILTGKLFIFADDKALVNFEDTWEKLKQIVEISLQCLH